MFKDFLQLQILNFKKILNHKHYRDIHKLFLDITLSQII